MSLIHTAANQELQKFTSYFFLLLFGLSNTWTACSATVSYERIVSLPNIATSNDANAFA